MGGYVGPNSAFVGGKITLADIVQCDVVDSKVAGPQNFIRTRWLFSGKDNGLGLLQQTISAFSAGFIARGWRLRVYCYERFGRNPCEFDEVNAGRRWISWSLLVYVQCSRLFCCRSVSCNFSRASSLPARSAANCDDSNNCNLNSCSSNRCRRWRKT